MHHDYKLIYNKNIKHYTWLKVGGKAEIVFKPNNLDNLTCFLKQNTKRVNVIGAGSNILVKDIPIKGVTIRLNKNFNQINFIDKNTLEVGAGCLNRDLSNFACDNNFAGMEFLSTIPGTIGGGIAMNAGAYNNSYAKIIDTVTALDLQGNLKIINNNDIGFCYRGNNLKENWIFISATIKGHHDNSNNIKERINNMLKHRSSSQPINKQTAGSTFMNPIGQYKAWELIDKVGLRGYKVGNAQFSKKHANFMINLGNASSDDFEQLINIAKEKIRKEFGINLLLEIKIME